MAKPTIWVLGDQLTTRAATFDGLGPGDARVLLIESVERSRQLPYHKHKLVLMWSAMRHFAAELRDAGWDVDYHAVQDSFNDALADHLRRHAPGRILLLETAEYGAGQGLARAARGHGVSVDVVPNNMFLSDKAAFAEWAEGRKTLLLETFYRDMRRRTGLLMDGDAPAGGAWNYDRENRETPDPDRAFPAVPRCEPDEMTREVMAVVEDRFPDHFGTLDAFAWPVSRPDAEAFFQRFLDERLDLFGPFQDAIVMGEPALYHSLVSPLLNIGLLDPLSMCQAAERRWRDGKARLNSVEGFIRQIIGWREFLYQVYHHRMPGYLGVNHFDADLPLPRFYWEPDDTDMACVRDAVAALRANGINHHIQRLMVTGNFALIAGIRPQEVNEWYWLAYADAYEWVVSPNVLGMALYADGGVFATKPYAASANYINRMSDCCKHCRYDHRDATSGDGCPFNALYWDFLYRNRERLGANYRMARIYSTMDRKKDLAAIRRRANTLRERLRAGDRV